MFGERLVSSLVFAPLVAGAFYLGNYYFAALIAVTSVVASMEYRKIMMSAGVDIYIGFVPLTAAVALSAFFFPSLFAISLLGGVVAALSIALLRSGTAISALVSLSGVMYIGGLLGSLSLLRGGSQGMEWSFFVLFVTWATDVGAYLGGRTFGKHKMAPGISPSKSWEGAAFGLVAASMVGWALAGVFAVPVPFGLVGGAILGVLGELGDLVESSLKRFGKVKDSGHIMPGHGGILDRFDSLLFTAAGGLMLRTLYGLLAP